MNELNRALSDIRDIRRQVAQSTEFRGYGPLTLCATAAIAVAAGVVQWQCIGPPEAYPVSYIALWSATALLSAALIASQTLNRAKRMHSGMADEMIRVAAAQFLPAAIAGTLLTVAILRSGAPVVWLLPGLWQVLYSLGIFASCRFMPRPLLLVGVWYLLTGLASVALGDARALSPLVMGGAYGMGQLMIAGVLHAANAGGDDAE